MRKLTLRIAFPLFALVTGLLVALTVAASPADDGAEGVDGAERGVVARVNGEAIFLEDLERQLRDLHQEVEPGQRPDFDVDNLVRRLVNDTLFAQEARALGFADDGAIPRKLETLRHDMATKRLEREEIWQAVEVSPQEVRAAFERDYRRATLRVLTTYDREAAEDALERLHQGADFAELVAEVSVDPYKLRGGLVEGIARVDLQREIADAAFEEEPGSLLGPLRTSIGWSVVRVEEFQAADPERFAALEGEVEEVLRFRKSRQRRSELTAELRRQHPVEVDPEVLASVDAERQPDSRLLPRAEDEDAVLATVGERELTAGELVKALAWRWKGIRNEEAALAAVPLVLEDLVEEKLLLAEALERGYHRAPEVDRSAAAYERDLLVERYLQEVLAPQVEVEHQAMEDYYAEHRERFNRPPRVHVSQITVESEEEAARLAEQVREGTDFAWLARRHSIDRFKDSGGERGWMYPRPDTDDLSTRLLGAEAGDVLGPVGVPGNYAVLRVNAKEKQGPYPFEQVSGNVRSALFRQRLQAFIGEALDTLRSRSEIEVNRAALDDLSISGTREPAAGGSGHGGSGHGGHAAEAPDHGHGAHR